MLEKMRESSGRATFVELLLVTAGLAPDGLARAAEVDGFTEPFRTINVAAVETGTIKTLDVVEGDSVEKGQVLARLDDAVYQALLAIAGEAMRAQGSLQAARAELKLYERRAAKLTTLRSEGHARQDELDRALADVEIAAGRVRTAEEALRIKKLEHEKIKVQLGRRTIRAPVAGVVNVVHKDPGEFVAPNDPFVVELVQLDPLVATFSVPSFQAVKLRTGQTVPVFLEDVQKFVQGSVLFVAPVTEAESGTVRVKIEIANPKQAFRSGERCTLQWDSKGRRPKNRSSRP